METNSVDIDKSQATGDGRMDERWADLQYDRAYEYYFKGDWRCAEEYVRNAVKVKPFDPRYRLLLAQVYCAQELLNLAWSELETLKRYDPGNAGARSLEQYLRRKSEKTKSRHTQPTGLKAIFKSLFNAS